jgi:hypothetical protein
MICQSAGRTRLWRASYFQGGVCVAVKFIEIINIVFSVF